MPGIRKIKLDKIDSLAFDIYLLKNCNPDGDDIPMKLDAFEFASQVKYEVVFKGISEESIPYRVIQTQSGVFEVTPISKNKKVR